ncbi:MAG TPA: nucleoside triphosphate pyrophosphohydrolase family protein [Verrucomicrobiae bacterium]|nr:nucleoside triphosphate pyrophosphohydrolase family protein [Verrucomicrobiae bacterium]
MTLNEYQQEADKTALYPNRGSNLHYPVLGLCGEAGEIAEKVKKLQRDRGNVIDDEWRNEMCKELGDVLWYISQVARELGLDLEQVGRMNIEKLRSRLQRQTLHGDGDNR